MNRWSLKIFNVIIFAMVMNLGSMAQFNNYRFSREIKGVNSQWHAIALPDEIYGKLANPMQDIRIYGFKEKNEYWEVPYVFKPNVESVNREPVVFKRINDSKNIHGYYFGFEVSKPTLINEFDLDFKEQNFDWLINLEGSQNQTDWFTIVEDYRVLSIKNELTNYQFTKLKFPNSTYKFYRVLVKSKEKPELLSAKLSFDIAIKDNFRLINTTPLKILQDKRNKRSILQLNLKQAVPISLLKVILPIHYDFYRSVIIQYVVDSFKSKNTWVYTYNELVSGTLSSLENNEFRFSSTIVKKIQVIIENQDNMPLEITGLEVKGQPYALQARFDEEGRYFLCYGNPKAEKPSYDIEKFIENIPKNMTELEVGKEIITKEIQQKQVSPIFENKIWLWVIMAVIMGVVAWFTLRMIVKKQ